MLRQVRTKRLAWAVMGLALALLVSANCLSAAAKTPEQHACCEAMAHDCGEIALESRCCDTRTDVLASVAPLDRIDAEALALSASVILLALPEPLDRPAVVRTATTSAPVKPPGNALYLAVSSLRI